MHYLKFENDIFSVIFTFLLSDVLRLWHIYGNSDKIDKYLPFFVFLRFSMAVLFINHHRVSNLSYYHPKHKILRFIVRAIILISLGIMFVFFRIENAKFMSVIRSNHIHNEFINLTLLLIFFFYIQSSSHKNRIQRQQEAVHITL